MFLAKKNPAFAGAEHARVTRIPEIDMLRGFAIVLMALDHARDYFHNLAFAFDPLDAAQTTTSIYLTRWITHLCAPTFLLLAGVSASLQLERGKSRKTLSRLLATRGLWLIFLELTVLSFGWSFSYPYVLFLQVIWTIGWCMIALAGLFWAPQIAVLALGVMIIAGHNLLDFVPPESFGAFSVIWVALHSGGPIFADGRPIVLFAYPILPWTGVIAFGFGLGRLFSSPPATRDRIILIIGIVFLALFLALRGFGLYGDAAVATAAGPFGALADWREAETAAAMVMAFFNVQKYPPSLMFVLATLGAVFTAWPLLTRLRGPIAKALATFGAAPFLFYVLHVYLTHALAIAANAAVGRDVNPLFDYMANVLAAPGGFQTVGFSLP
ncbi:MAG TPA: heparan-alpha-glucosaminide N-acetyltransferase domain-containing protein, partial [Parvularculaceae bacterium]|nr:heparan-alpha-glucosaminide N-acetyltransferase domain-containing protein [Parvularculaceae bacterium]